jgi:hypothetical protein
LSIETTSQALLHLAEQIKKAREEDDFFETDLRTWTSTLEKLKQMLKTASLTNHIGEDETTSLIYPIQIFASSSKARLSEVNDKNRSNDHRIKSNTISSNERFDQSHGNTKIDKGSIVMNAEDPF